MLWLIHKVVRFCPVLFHLCAENVRWIWESQWPTKRPRSRSFLDINQHNWAFYRWEHSLRPEPILSIDTASWQLEKDIPLVVSFLLWLVVLLVNVKSKNFILNKFFLFQGKFLNVSNDNIADAFSVVRTCPGPGRMFCSLSVFHPPKTNQHVSGLGHHIPGGKPWLSSAVIVIVRIWLYEQHQTLEWQGCLNPLHTFSLLILGNAITWLLWLLCFTGENVEAQGDENSYLPFFY